jgi:hypothetical protein
LRDDEPGEPRRDRLDIIGIELIVERQLNAITISAMMQATRHTRVEACSGSAGAVFV